MSQTIGMYSGGICSFFAALRSKPDVLLFSDTGIEDQDLYRFLEESSAFLNISLVKISIGKTLFELATSKRMMPNNRVPFCSRILKVEPAQKWIRENAPGCNIVFGIDWTESHRCDRIRARWVGHNCIFPMVEPPYMTRADMMRELVNLGLDAPRLYEVGMPHNNCGGGCVRGGIGHWIRVFHELPSEYQKWSDLEQHISAMRGKPCTILRDRRNGRTLPMSLVELAKRIESSDASLDKLDFGGCGCFTE